MPCFSSTALLTLLFALPSVAQLRSLLFSHIFSGAHSSRSLLLPRPVPSSLASPSFPPVLRGGKHSVAMITVSEDQVRWYRQKKSFLANEPAPSMEAAASAAIGIQCQVIPHGLMQLWNRLGQRGSSKDSQSTAKSSKRQRKKSSQAEVSCTSTLTMASMATEIFEQYRLVHIRGHRRTLHLYNPETDWALICACLSGDVWKPVASAFDIEQISDKTIERAKQAMERRKTATRGDLMADSVVSPAELRASEALVKKNAGKKGTTVAFSASLIDPERRVTAQVVDTLFYSGHVCNAGRRGAESVYGARSACFPCLRWDPPPPLLAARLLCSRYLATYGPATADDVAYFFGARKKDAVAWLQKMEEEKEVEAVECGGRKGLYARKADLQELQCAVPAEGSEEWGVRVLGMYDSFVLAHADKSWLCGTEGTASYTKAYKQLFRPGAVVAGCVLRRGQVVGAVAVSSKGLASSAGGAPLAGAGKKRAREEPRELEVTVTRLEGWCAEAEEGTRVELEAMRVAWEATTLNLTLN